MRIITFYTDDSYKLKAEGLKASAESFGLECVLLQKPDLGEWWSNCNQKCEVIREALETYGDEPLIWNDADCRYVRKPILFDALQDYDLAAVFLNANSHPFGGTLWFNGRRALPYVNAWCANVKRYPTHEDDSTNFRMALHQTRPKNLYHLPPEYCWREYDFRAAVPGGNPVIVHTTDGTHDYPVTHLSQEEVTRLYSKANG